MESNRRSIFMQFFINFLGEVLCIMALQNIGHGLEVRLHHGRETGIGWQRFQLDYTFKCKILSEEIFGEGDDQEGVLSHLLQSFYVLFDNVDTINRTNLWLCRCIELGHSQPCQMLAKMSLDLKLTQW